MSRYYRLDMEVKKTEIEDAEFGKIRRVFEEEWGKDGYAEVIQDNGHSIAVFSSERNLCGGESEDEAHERIRDAVKRAIGKCEVKTRWTYLEELPHTAYVD